MRIIYTIKKTKDFTRIYNRGRYAACKDIVIYWLPNESRPVGKRFGFSLSKKLGKAVKRNRIKRVLKEICRLNDQWFAKGYDYVIVPRKGSAQKSCRELQDDISGLVKKMEKHLFTEKEN